MKKNVRDTSTEVYRSDIMPSLNRRERIVFDALQECDEPPTGYELTEFLKERHQAFDVNSCRPRLTGLLKKHKVELGPKRKCRITGKRSYTWRIAEPQPQLLNFGSGDDEQTATR